jgi:hypothetical protein
VIAKIAEIAKIAKTELSIVDWSGVSEGGALVPPIENRVNRTIYNLIVAILAILAILAINT